MPSPLAPTPVHPESMPIPTSDDSYARSVAALDDRDTHRALGDLRARLAGRRSLLPTQVIRHPAVVLLNGVPPGEGKFDMLFRNPALSGTPRAMTTEVSHRDLRDLP